MDPLHTPIDVAGATQPGRVVTVEDGAAAWPPGPSRCGPGLAAWGAWVSAPDTEDGLGHAQAGGGPRPWRRAPAWWPWPTAPR